MYKAFFLDKDGTIVDNSKYPEVIPTDLLLEDQILEGLNHIQNKGFKIFIVSNQPWISKSQMSKEQIDKIFYNVLSKLKNKGIFIEDFFYCPHQSSDNCDCKKPKNKLILQAAEKYNLDLSQSYIVGDMDTDIQTGKNSGMKTILVLTGKGKEYLNKTDPDYIINNLNEINKVI